MASMKEAEQKSNTFMMKNGKLFENKDGLKSGKYFERLLKKRVKDNISVLFWSRGLWV